MIIIASDDKTLFSKTSIFKMFEVHTVKPAFSYTSSSKSVLKKLRFRDGLVWTVDPTRKIKLRS